MSQSNSSTFPYRPEIDGLRAFAVLSVVVFHAFPTWLTGGFIGVDVFFVISGFLITSHIFENLDKKQFSIADFFGRRIRRIFPALILVMASVLAVGWFVLLNDEYAQLGKHVASGAAFIVNFILVDESGYFDNAAQTKPMLHLWSLAVEEQFYIIWPLVLWFAWKRRFNLFAITLVVAMASFYLNLSYVSSKPVEMFFWPVGRFWELLSGSMLAWLMLYKKEHLISIRLSVDNYLGRFIRLKSLTLANILSLFGLLLLGYGVIGITENIAFLAAWMVIPVFGALLVISAGSKAWFNRLFLMNPIAIWFGLISYPLYLWHWPILVFPRIIGGVEISNQTALFGIAISIALAAITFKFVERPIQKRAVTKSTSLTLVGLLVCVGAIGWFIYSQNGIPKRMVSETKLTSQVDFHQYLSDHYIECEPNWMFSKSIEYKGHKRCWQSKQGAPSVALIGESHAEHLFIGLADSAASNVVYYIAGIPTLAAVKRMDVFEHVVSDDDIQTVILTMRYELHIGRKHIVDLYSQMKDTIKYFQAHGKRVAIASDTPQFKIDPNGCVGRPFKNLDPLCTLSYEQLNKQKQIYESVLLRLSEEFGVTYVDLNNPICSDRCNINSGATSLFRDRDHLSILGSKIVGGYLAQELGLVQ